MSVMILTYWNFPFFPGVDDDKRHCIIGGYAQVCGHVEGRSEADYDYTYNKAQNADRHGRINDHCLQECISKLGYVPKKKTD